MGHWYDKDGTPCYEVPYKDESKGMRSATIKDARKYGWVPSVTTIINVLDKPGLNNWLQGQTLLAAATTPRNDLPDELWIKKVKSSAGEVARIARDTGSEIHNAIEHVFKAHNDPFYSLPTQHLDLAQSVYTAVIGRYGKGRWSPELSFGNDMGFGGKADLIHIMDNIVIDFKTKEKLQKKMGYDEHLMQLTAYAYGFGMEDIDNRTLVNCFVSWDGEIEFVEWSKEEEQERAWMMFKSCLNLWMLKNKYGGKK